MRRIAEKNDSGALRGRVALNFGRHVRTLGSAYICHQFPHGLRRMLAVVPESLRCCWRSASDDDGSRERRGFSRCDNVETAGKVHGLRMVRQFRRWMQNADP